MTERPRNRPKLRSWSTEAHAQCAGNRGGEEGGEEGGGVRATNYHNWSAECVINR